MTTSTIHVLIVTPVIVCIMKQRAPERARYDRPPHDSTFSIGSYDLERGR
jgi:hypothetical protein